MNRASSSSSAPARVPASALLRETGVVAVLRARHAVEYAPVIDALQSGGVLSIELTLSTEGVFDEIDALRRRFGDAVELGIGTVTTLEQLESAIESGADYIVTPITDTAIIDRAVNAALPVFPGGYSPTELFAGWQHGATAVKLFPASSAGTGYLGQLRGPFPELQVIPSGGVGIDDVSGWIQAGVLAVSLGGPLIQDAFTGGDLQALRTRAATVIDIVDRARSSASHG